MSQPEVLRQRDWNEAELAAAGFAFHPARPRVVMARELPPREAPLTIVTPWDTLVAEAGFMICFETTPEPRAALYDYPHWPVNPEHFRGLYVAWEDPAWVPSPVEQQLLALGCRPYTKIGGVWAKRLAAPALVQSTESPDPVLVPTGAWLCLAAHGAAWGAPYSMSDEDFAARYESVASGAD